MMIIAHYHGKQGVDWRREAENSVLLKAVSLGRDEIVRCFIGS